LPLSEMVSQAVVRILLSFDVVNIFAATTFPLICQ
jgi:hypothetical protein